MTSDSFGNNLDVFELFSEGYERTKHESMSLRDYLLAARDDPIMYASPAERMIAAIGEPEMVDTSKDPRLSRIFFNRTIRQYKAFEGFYGMEDTIEHIVAYFRQAAQGLEEKRQVLYLLGPVGGGKSSLAERLKDLMEENPIYVLKAGDEVSPVFESPLGLFQSDDLKSLLEEKYGIDKRRLSDLMSPWADKRWMNLAALFQNSKWSNSIPLNCARLPFQKQNLEMKTIRIYLRWLARSIFANLNISLKTIPTPIPIPAVYACPIRVCWNLLKCLKRRSKCFIHF